VCPHHPSRRVWTKTSSSRSSGPGTSPARTRSALP
jgi:hypothetical protein